MVEIGKFIQKSYTGQNGKILVKMVKIIFQGCTSQVLVKNVEIWSKQSNLCCRVVLVKQLMKRLKWSNLYSRVVLVKYQSKGLNSEQNGQSYAVELYWLNTC